MGASSSGPLTPAIPTSDGSATEARAKYNLFFSHKTQDARVVKALIEIILDKTENLGCFISEDIEKGTDWRAAIARELTLANFLVLVFTDPKEDWGWCLYETGFFEALKQFQKTRRVWCLHNASNSPPKPIENLQCTAADHNNVTTWLTDLYTLTEQPPHRRNKIPEVATQICSLFADPKQLIYSADFITLSVNYTQLNSPDDLPDDTTIEGDDRLIGEVFGRRTDKLNWKSAKEMFRQVAKTSEANLSALKEISRAIYRVYNGGKVVSVQGTIFVDEGPKRYRPVISNAKQSAAGYLRCEVLLVEDAGGPLQNVDKNLGVLLTCIRMAVRIRWEIIRPFVSSVRRLATADPRKLRFDLQTCLNNVFLEAEFRGNYSAGDVTTAFETEGEISKILAMIEKFDQIYPRIWKGIGFANVMQTFGKVSEQPFGHQDLELLETGLRELEKMNTDFLEIAVRRAAVLIESDIGVQCQVRRDKPTEELEIARVLAGWNTYVPYGVFRIKWARKRDRNGYDAADMVGEPTVSSGNYEFLRLFQLAGDHVPDPDTEEPLTLNTLMEFIRESSSQGDFVAFDGDQKRVVDEIIMKDRYGQVKVVMRLSDPEDQHRKRTFLPLLVAKRTVGDTKGPHATYLLVAYVETSANAGSFRSATVQSLSGPPVLCIASDSTRSAAD